MVTGEGRGLTSRQRAASMIGVLNPLQTFLCLGQSALWHSVLCRV